MELDAEMNVYRTLGALTLISAISVIPDTAEAAPCSVAIWPWERCPDVIGSDNQSDIGLKISETSKRDLFYESNIKNYGSGDVYARISINDLKFPKRFNCRGFGFLDSAFNSLVGSEGGSQISLAVFVDTGPITQEGIERAAVMEVVRITRESGENCSAENAIIENGEIAKVRAENSTDLTVRIALTETKSGGFDIEQLAKDAANAASNNMSGLLADVTPLVGDLLKTSFEAKTVYKLDTQLVTYPVGRNDPRTQIDVEVPFSDELSANFKLTMRVDPYHTLESVARLDEAQTVSLLRPVIFNGEARPQRYNIGQILSGPPNILPKYDDIKSDLALLHQSCRMVASKLWEDGLSRRAINRFLSLMMKRFGYPSKLDTVLGRTVCLTGTERDEYFKFAARTARQCPQTGNIDNYIMPKIRELRADLANREREILLVKDELIPAPDINFTDHLKRLLGQGNGFARGHRCYRAVSGNNSGNIPVGSPCGYIAVIDSLDAGKWNWVYFETVHRGNGVINIPTVSIGISPWEKTTIGTNDPDCKKYWPERESADG